MGFLAIFLPLLSRTGDVKDSLFKALPLLFICICTFIANDLNDVEADRINHPARPLPTGEIKPIVATGLYFVSMGLGLFLTRAFVEQTIAFWYYGLFLVSVSYNFVVGNIPVLKAPYVAFPSAVPVLIVASFFPETRLYMVACSVWLVTLGRELCMGVSDREGDEPSFLTKVDPAAVSRFAFGAQAVGLFVVASQTERILDAIVLVAMLGLLVFSGVLWFRFERFFSSIILMKLQLFAGLYFLL